jgi:hypothetical protein
MAEELEVMDGVEDEVVSGDQSQGDDGALVEQARETGWVPKEEFKGNPDAWTDAETWVENANKIMPLLRANNKKLLEEKRNVEQGLEMTKSELNKLKATMDKMLKMNEKINDRIWDRDVSEITRMQREAAEAGDVVRFDALEKEKKAVIEQKKKDFESPVEPEQKANGPSPAFVDWHRSNDWYLKDEDMTRYANAYSAELVQKGYSEQMMFDEVTKKVKEVFQNKFANTRRKSQAVSDSDGTVSTRKLAKHSYENLPTEAKKQCDKFVKEIPGYTKEMFVNDWDWD